MKANTLLVAISIVSLAVTVGADFSDITGKIIPLNASSSEKIRNYTTVLSPEDNPRTAIFIGTVNQTAQQSNQSSSNSSSQDALIYSLNTQSMLTLLASYYKTYQNQSSGNQTSGNSTQQNTTTTADFGSMLQHLYLIEYSDMNQQPGFQMEGDNITGWYNLSSPGISWNLTHNETEVKFNNDSFIVHSLIAETSDKVFALRFLLIGRPVNISDVQVKSDEAKFDVRIQWYQSNHVASEWTSGPSNSSMSRLGLVSAFGASQGTPMKNNSIGDTRNSSEVRFMGSSYESFFRWPSQANASMSNTTSNSSQTNSTGAQMTMIPVIVTELTSSNTTNSSSSSSMLMLNDSLPSNWNKLLVVHSFQASQPSEILWDPQFGLKIASNQSSSRRRSFFSWFFE